MDSLDGDEFKLWNSYSFSLVSCSRDCRFGPWTNIWLWFADDTKPQKRRGSSSDEDAEGADADLEKELNEELKSFEVVGGDSKHDEKEIDSLLDLKWN